MTPTTAAALSAAIIATATAAMLALRRCYTVIIVRGPSMTPTLQPGEKVLARRVRGQAVRRGDIVILRVPGLGADGAPNRHTAVKRVAATAGDPLPSFLPASFRRLRPRTAANCSRPGSWPCSATTRWQARTRGRGVWSPRPACSAR